MTLLRPGRLLFILVVLLGFGSSSIFAQPMARSEVSRQIMTATNMFRAQNDLPQLTSSPALEKAAVSHSVEMLELGYFSHDSPRAAREKTSDRVKLAGATPNGLAENIYGCTGFPTDQVAAECLASWLESPKHRANLLNDKYTHVGIGVAEVNGTFRVTQVLSGNTAAVTASSAASPGNASGSAPDIASQILEESNKRRLDADLEALQTDPILTKAALLHCEEMARLNYFGHQSPYDERSRVRQRVRLAGSDPLRLGENLYRCSGYARETVALRTILALMESDGHRDNLLNDDFSRVGIGVYELNGKYYVTQVLAGDS